MIEVVMRHDGQFTSPFEVLIDTGADCCLFDPPIAYTIGWNPSGPESSVGGLGGTDQSATIEEVDLYFPDLKLRVVTDAAFSVIPGRIGMAGILGHTGFLERFEICFSRRRYFEISDEKPLVRPRLVQ